MNPGTVARLGKRPLDSGLRRDPQVGRNPPPAIRIPPRRLNPGHGPLPGKPFATMAPMSHPETLIILNPAAGDKSDPAEVAEWVQAHPGARLKRTRGPGDARRWARDAATEGVRVIAAAGGDGTVNEVGSGIVAAAGTPEGEAPGSCLAIIPMGTGNDLARTLDIPLGVGDALALLEAEGRERVLDILEVRLDGEAPRIVLNAITGGFAGELNQSLTDEVKEAWGPLSYLRTGMELWGERATWGLDLSSEERDGHVQALNLVVANGRSAGGGIPVAPGADPQDGRMDVLIIREAEGLELSGLAARMLGGLDTAHPALERFQTREVDIRSANPVPLSLDGEPDQASHLHVRLLSGALRVRVPY